MAGLGAAGGTSGVELLGAAASCPRRDAEEGKHKWRLPEGQVLAVEGVLESIELGRAVVVGRTRGQVVRAATQGPAERALETEPGGTKGAGLVKRPPAVGEGAGPEWVRFQMPEDPAHWRARPRRVAEAAA